MSGLSRAWTRATRTRSATICSAIGIALVAIVVIGVSIYAGTAVPPAIVGATAVFFILRWQSIRRLDSAGKPLYWSKEPNTRGDNEHFWIGGLTILVFALFILGATTISAQRTAAALEEKDQNERRQARASLISNYEVCRRRVRASLSSRDIATISAEQAAAAARRTPQGKLRRDLRRFGLRFQAVGGLQSIDDCESRYPTVTRFRLTAPEQYRLDRDRILDVIP